MVFRKVPLQCFISYIFLFNQLFYFTIIHLGSILSLTAEFFLGINSICLSIYNSYVQCCPPQTPVSIAGRESVSARWRHLAFFGGGAPP